MVHYIQMNPYELIWGTDQQEVHKVRLNNVKSKTNDL
jgi:hypothetical protein